MVFPEKYRNLIGTSDLEEMDVGKLLNFQEDAILESDLLRITKKSPIYKKKWKHVKSNLKNFQLEALSSLPYITNDDIGEFGEDINRTVMTTPRHWFYNLGTTKTSWIPYSTFDVFLLLNLVNRGLRVVGLKDYDILLNVGYSAPEFGDVLPFLIGYSQKIRGEQGINLEILSVSLDLLLLGMNRLDFAERLQPSTFLMKPSAAVKIKEYFAAPLKNLKRGIFYGEPVADYRSKILEQYPGIEIFEMYTKIENIGFNVECTAHKGVHMWLDNCIPEIIPRTELELEKENQGYVPSATHFCDAKAEMTGELVMTMFREAFPLVRYRTGDMITIEGINRCECGRTHPRISFNKKDIIIEEELKKLKLETPEMTRLAIEL